MTDPIHSCYWQTLNQAVKDSGDPTARRNQLHNVYDGTQRFQEWSKARLAYLRDRAKAIVEA